MNRGLRAATASRRVRGLALALLAVVAAVLSQAVPSTEAVRLRNALLIGEGEAAPGGWTPEDAPPSFLRERLPVPELVARGAAAAVAGLAPGAGAIDKARAVSGHLNGVSTLEGGIRAVDVEGTYRAMLSQHRGYCSDVIDVFVAMMLSQGVAVRPWAFSFDGFGGHGHVLVEVYDDAQARWVMLDVFNNVMPLDRATGRSLDVAGFRSRFAADAGSVEFAELAPGPRRMPRDDVQRAYYARGLDEWYLWNGNNVVERAEQPAARALGAVFEPFGEAVMIATGRYPSIVPVLTDTNRLKVAAMHRLRTMLLAALAVAIALAVALAIEVARLLARPGSTPVVDAR